eukprot:m.13340 g.13340  ORF g.13340 m.13340 type:complete len:141 (+) comp9688_c0_seq1:337-759(+)
MLLAMAGTDGKEWDNDLARSLAVPGIDEVASVLYGCIGGGILGLVLVPIHGGIVAVIVATLVALGVVMALGNLTSWTLAAAVGSCVATLIYVFTQAAVEGYTNIGEALPYVEPVVMGMTAGVLAGWLVDDIVHVTREHPS